MEDNFVPVKHYAIQSEPPPANTDNIKRKFLGIPNASLSQLHKLDIYLPAADEGSSLRLASRTVSRVSLSLPASMKSFSQA